MPESVLGLPTHAILVHATVVLLPLAALAVLLHAFWPTARHRLGVVTPLLAGAALVLVPLSTASGEDLDADVGRTELRVEFAGIGRTAADLLRRRVFEQQIRARGAHGRRSRA